jgi:hypothetical protein
VDASVGEGQARPPHLEPRLQGIQHDLLQVLDLKKNWVRAGLLNKTGCTGLHKHSLDLRADVILLYTIGSLILKLDCHDLEVLLETFHAGIELQEHCRTVDANERRYLTLRVNGVEPLYGSGTN